MRVLAFVSVGLAAGLAGYFVRDAVGAAEQGAQADPMSCPPPSPPKPPPAPEPCADADACNHLAATLDDADPAAALAARERACDLDDPEACMRAAHAEHDPAQALVLEDHACDFDLAPACLDAGNAYVKGVGTAADPERGWRLVEEACEHGSEHACVEMWDRYHAAHDGLMWGASLRVCDLGGVPAPEDALDVGYACYFRGQRLERADGDSRRADVEYARAVSHFAAACSHRAADCYELAAALEDGVGVRPDRERARADYRTACDAGTQRACAALGEMLIRGEGGPRDGKRGRQLRATACRAGVEDACE